MPFVLPFGITVPEPNIHHPEAAFDTIQQKLFQAHHHIHNAMALGKGAAESAAKASYGARQANIYGDVIITHKIPSIPMVNNIANVPEWPPKYQWKGFLQ